MGKTDGKIEVFSMAEGPKGKKASNIQPLLEPLNLVPLRGTWSQKNLVCEAVGMGTGGDQSLCCRNRDIEQCNHTSVLETSCTA